MKASPLLATIDIGSNSILLLAGRIVQGKLQVELQRKETIRLGGALDAQGMLQAEAMERGLDCLRRYAELITHIAPQYRRAVATQTLREAGNRHEFLQQASTILGCDVALISGEQEAELIYQGVSSLLPANQEQRLIVDIGGRSTEICSGRGQQLQTAMSCPIGSVAWAMRFFGDGSLSASRFQQAQTTAQELLTPLLRQLPRHAREHVYGSSGTAGAISKALNQSGHAPNVISIQGLQQLREYLQQAGHIDQLPQQGVRDELRPVIGGGVSIMCAVFDALGIDSMRIAQGALRHGLLFRMFQEHHQTPSVHA